MPPAPLLPADETLPPLDGLAPAVPALPTAPDPPPDVIDEKAEKPEPLPQAASKLATAMIAGRFPIQFANER